MIARKPYFPPLSPALKEIFAAEGLELVGISDAPSAPQAEREYREWLSKGYAGSMRYLARHAPLKYRPATLLEGARSILFAGINYLQHSDHQASRGEGRIARYAWGRDYHRVMGSKLGRITKQLRKIYPEDSFRPSTDATPLAERFYAERAGIGFAGRNTLLISSQYGSWFLLGEVISTRAFEPSGAAGGKHGNCSSSCRRCLDVCPTGALIAAKRIDASRCISYLTIEHKGSIPEGLRPKMGNWLFGCDLCQEVCPLNLGGRETNVSDFVRLKAGAVQELEAILTIKTEEEFRARFAGSPLMRAKRTGLLRNACIVAANNGAVELLPLLRDLRADSDSVIAEHAHWAAARLTTGWEGH